LIAIGINPWFTPQSSLHCPKKVPVLVINNEVWFNRPGHASTFIPKEGIAQLCSTSAEVIRTLI